MLSSLVNALFLRGSAAVEGRARIRCLPLLVFCLTLLAPYPADAQVLGWGGLETSIELGYSQERQNTAQNNGPDSNFDSDRFRERLHLRSRGLYALDPRLVTINLAAGIEYFQENNDFTGLSGSQDGRLFNYAVESMFFTQKPYSVQLYANRTEDRVSRNFGTRTNVVTTVRGARFALREDSVLKDMGLPYFSTSLGVNQLKIREDSSGSGQDFRRNEDHDVLQYDAHKGYQTADLRFHYQYDDIKDNLRADNGFTTNTANLNYSLDFGPTLNWRWASINNYVRRSGLNGNDTFTTNQNLRINHNVDLLSNYQYTFNRFRTEFGTTQSSVASFLISKRVYNSLTSSLNALGSLTDLPEGETKSYGGGPAFSYQRNIPAHGRLSLRANGTYRINDNNLNSNTIQAQNEPHQVAPVFPVGDPGFLLNNPFVVEASIVVVDRRDGGQLPTIPGVDYEVIAEGDSTRIRPLPTSAILQAEDPLEVSYSYEVAPSISFSTTLLSLGGTIDFGWIALSVAHYVSNQRRLSGTDNGFLQDRSTDTVNLRLNGKWQRLQGSAEAGYKREDSTNQKYSRWRFGQSISYPGFHGMTLTANATESFTSFDEPRPRRSNSYTANIALNGVIGSGWMTRMFAGILIITDTEIDNQSTARAGINVKRNIGRLTLTGSLQWNKFDRGPTNTTDRRIDIRALRRF